MYAYIDSFRKFGKTNTDNQSIKIKRPYPDRIPLSECTAEDLLLMGSGQLEDGPLFLLRFAHAPEAGNSLQQFELKLTDERGGTYTVRTDVCKW